MPESRLELKKITFWVVMIFALVLIWSHSVRASVDAPESEVQVLKWTTLAAGEGNVYARERLAVWYYFGSKVPRDYNTALAWLRKAMESGSSLARKCFADVDPGGEGAPSAAENLCWLRMGVAEGNVKALARLGERLFRGDGLPANPKRAVRYLVSAAEKGSARAQYLVGLAYAQGRGVGADEKAAVKWLRRSVQQNFPDAQRKLGEMYLQGEGVARNVAAGVPLLRQAAWQGSVRARALLWALQQQGRVQAETPVEERQWLVAAADAGNPQAQTRYGDLWFQRKETSYCLTNFSFFRMAAFWYWKAARQGDPAAQYRLARMLWRGQGVKSSIEKAYVWSGLAARRKMRKAGELQKLLSARMSPAQAARARRELTKAVAREQARGGRGKLYLPPLAD